MKYKKGNKADPLRVEEAIPSADLYITSHPRVSTKNNGSSFFIALKSGGRNNKKKTRVDTEQK